MAAISQAIFSTAFLIITFGFQINFHWNVFLRVWLTIWQHWFRGIGADQAPSHHLKQWRYALLTHICVTRPESVNAVPEWSTQRTSTVRFCRLLASANRGAHLFVKTATQLLQDYQCCMKHGFKLDVFNRKAGLDSVIFFIYSHMKYNHGSDYKIIYWQRNGNTWIHRPLGDIVQVLN